MAFRMAKTMAAGILIGILAVAASAGAAERAAARSDSTQSRSWLSRITPHFGVGGFFERLYEKLSSVGLGSGSWRERKSLDAGLDAFTAMDDAKLQRWNTETPRYDDPFLREARATLVAVMMAQRGSQEQAEKIYTSYSPPRPSSDGARLIGETLMVLSDGRSQWDSTRRWCESSIQDREHDIPTLHLVDADEFHYACARAAAFAGDWKWSLRAAAAADPQSDFAPFAWYAAGAAAARAEEYPAAERALQQVVRNFETWVATQRDPAHRSRPILWSGGRDLVRDWALAALVYVYEEAGQSSKARAAFRRVKTTSPVYDQAVASLKDEDASVAFASLSEHWMEHPEAAVAYSEWLARTGHELVAGRVLEDAMHSLRQTTNFQKDVSSDVWASDKLAIESQRIAREREWRAGLAQRVRGAVGSFFTSPIRPSPMPESMAPFEKSVRASRLATETYLRTAELRQPLRNCIVDEGPSEHCKQLAASTLPGAASLAEEERRKSLYTAERLLSQGLLARTEELVKMGAGGQGTAP